MNQHETPTRHLATVSDDEEDEHAGMFFGPPSSAEKPYLLAVQRQIQRENSRSLSDIEEDTTPQADVNVVVRNEDNHASDPSKSPPKPEFDHQGLEGSHDINRPPNLKLALPGLAVSIESHPTQDSTAATLTSTSAIERLEEAFTENLLPLQYEVAPSPSALTPISQDKARLPNDEDPLRAVPVSEEVDEVSRLDIQNELPSAEASQCDSALSSESPNAPRISILVSPPTDTPATAESTPASLHNTPPPAPSALPDAATNDSPPRRLSLRLRNKSLTPAESPSSGTPTPDLPSPVPAIINLGSNSLEVSSSYKRAKRQMTDELSQQDVEAPSSVSRRSKRRKVALEGIGAKDKLSPQPPSQPKSPREKRSRSRSRDIQELHGTMAASGSSAEATIASLLELHTLSPLQTPNVLPQLPPPTTPSIARVSRELFSMSPTSEVVLANLQLSSPSKQVLFQSPTPAESSLDVSFPSTLDDTVSPLDQIHFHSLPASKGKVFNTAVRMWGSPDKPVRASGEPSDVLGPPATPGGKPQRVLVNKVTPKPQRILASSSNSFAASSKFHPSSSPVRLQSSTRPAHPEKKPHRNDQASHGLSSLGSASNIFSLPSPGTVPKKFSPHARPPPRFNPESFVFTLPSPLAAVSPEKPATVRSEPTRVVPSKPSGLPLPKPMVTSRLPRPAGILLQRDRDRLGGSTSHRLVDGSPAKPSRLPQPSPAKASRPPVGRVQPRKPSSNSPFDHLEVLPLSIPSLQANSSGGESSSPPNSPPHTPPTPIDVISEERLLKYQAEAAIRAERRSVVAPERKSKPAKIRRQVNSSSSSLASQSDSLSFGYMTATQMRNLTAANTLRNQTYYTVLDRQVETRDQPRPPSPSSKVRTVLQKEKDEAEIAREERAKRRSARRSTDSEDTVTNFGDGNQNCTPQRPDKHPRAPGDDEDYTTPAKKRARFDPAAAPAPPVGKDRANHGERRRKDTGKGKGRVAEVARKTVRWDKLLAVTPRVPQTGDPSVADTKPLLRKAQLPSLDAFGNLIDVSPPLAEFIERKTVQVTRIVYFDDPEYQKLRKGKRSA